MGWNHQPEVSLGSTEGPLSNLLANEGLVSGSPDAKNVYKLSFWGGGGVDPTHIMVVVTHGILKSVPWNWWEIITPWKFNDIAPQELPSQKESGFSTITGVALGWLEVCGTHLYD